MKENSARYSHVARNNTCFSLTEKISDSQGRGFSAQKSLASVWGKIIPRMSTVLIPSTNLKKLD